jgi:hypothetical protein
VISLLAISEFFILTFTNIKSGILCTGCYSDVFGFPRINLFAAEPQFLANSMLPFFFVSLAWFYKHRAKLALYSMILSAVVIGLTFSRGAYFAVGAGFVGYVALLWYSKKLQIKPFTTVSLIVLASFLVSSLMLIWSASYKFSSTTNISYNTAVSMLDHMSLGIINLESKPVLVNTAIKPANSFVPSGLIKASTTDRIGAADLALNSWHNNTKTTFIGVGPGNLGPYTVKNVDSTVPNNLTVYIYYILLLAEVGLIGFIAFIVVYLSALNRFMAKYKNHKLAALYVAVPAIIIAFLAQYLFFGTFINSVYVWLWTGIILGLTGTKLKNKL